MTALSLLVEVLIRLAGCSDDSDSDGRVVVAESDARGGMALEMEGVRELENSERRGSAGIEGFRSTVLEDGRGEAVGLGELARWGVGRCLSRKSCSAPLR